MQICIKSHQAHVIFHSMAEGMAEVRDERGDTATVTLLDRLVKQTAEQIEPADIYPKVIELEADLLTTVQAVLENCAELTMAATADDPDVLHDGDVVLTA
jgi:hypothetical protein